MKTEEIAEMSEKEKEARELYYSLNDINEYGRLLQIGVFPGSDAKSIIKCDAFFSKYYKDTKLKIEENEWYIEEKAAIQALNMKDCMGTVKGEYNPEYKVVMADVFRKVFK